MLASKPLVVASPIETLVDKKQENTSKFSPLRILVWVCLLLACLGTNWFAYQYFLIPQPRSFVPDWHGAQWIQAEQHTLPVAYFAYGMNLNVVPEGAFITIAASQSYHLYVNGKIIGTSAGDMTKLPRAYMYDILSTLTRGANVVAVRVDNFDDQPPALQLSLGIVLGQSTIYHVTGRDSWKATSQSSLVYPQAGINQVAWTRLAFKRTAWQLAQQTAHAAMIPTVMVNPALYEKPSPDTWISGGVNSDTYFLRQIDVPSTVTNTWLRLASTGVVNVFINGNLYITKNSLPATKEGQITYFEANGTTVSNDIPLGMYDISPYLHSGLNTIAMHLSFSGLSGVQDGLTTTSSALAVDLLMTNSDNSNQWIGEDGWHVSHAAIPDWTLGSHATLAWLSPIMIDQPSQITNVYMSNTALPNATQVIPFALIGEVTLFSTAAILLTWVLLSLPLRNFYKGVARHRAFELTSLVFFPALACEGALVALSHEPQIARPFPYTSFWLGVLLTVVGVSYCLLLAHVLLENKKISQRLVNVLKVRQDLKRVYHTNTHGKKRDNGKPSLVSSLLSWLSVHWMLVLIVLIAIPLIFYNLSYEPYWQDELTSYLVAKSILKTGLPYLPSGFLYSKGELFSYVLALVMAIFGDQNGVPRAISATEYVLCLPLIYYVGTYFFNKHVAMLATAMLAFSPLALIWGRQVRMYEQAQLLSLLTLFLFYKAIEKSQRPRYVYLAVASLVACYLSHEETFIIMPALVVCILMVSMDRKRVLPSIFYNKHWWIASGIGITIIGIQLLIVHFSHPPLIGTDPSERSPLQLTTDNIAYYFYLLFWPTGNDSSITGTFISGTNTNIVANSVLALVGCVYGIRSTNMRIRYCAIFFALSFFTLVFAFTLQADRYFYPLLPVYYLLGSYALVRLLRLLWIVTQSAKLQTSAITGSEVHSLEKTTSLPIKMLVKSTILITCLVVVFTPLFPFTTYSLFTSRILNLPYYHQYSEYDDAVSYVNQHWQQGDIVISIIPDHVVAYYFKHLDYFILMDHALFLFEKDDHIVDTYTGKIGLFRQSDLQAVLASHARVWIVSGNNYYQKNAFMRFTLPPDFHIAYEGTTSIIYCRGE